VERPRVPGRWSAIPPPPGREQQYQDDSQQDQGRNDSQDDESMMPGLASMMWLMLLVMAFMMISPSELGDVLGGAQGVGSDDGLVVRSAGRSDLMGLLGQADQGSGVIQDTGSQGGASLVSGVSHLGPAEDGGDGCWEGL